MRTPQPSSPVGKHLGAAAPLQKIASLRHCTSRFGKTALLSAQPVAITSRKIAKIESNVTTNLLVATLQGNFKAIHCFPGAFLDSTASFRDVIAIFCAMLFGRHMLTILRFPFNIANYRSGKRRNGLGIRSQGSIAGKVVYFAMICEDVGGWRRSAMSSNLSVAQMLAQLETKVAYHKERQAFHTQQEVHHREQAALHAAELELATARLEAFRSAATDAGEILDRSRPLAAPGPVRNEDEDLAKGRTLSQMIARVLDDKAPNQTFGANGVTEEIHKRWGAKLRRRVDPRTVSATLRRWAAAGRIRCMREGKAHYEGLYVKGA